MPKPAPKYISLNDELYECILRHRSRLIDPVLDELRAETEAFGDDARMLIAREQGDLVTMLSKLLHARVAVEIGSFTGYSSICIARGLVRGGTLTCFDNSSEWTAIAKRYWRKAGVENIIELRLGNAALELPKWEPPAPIDLAFIDADKTGYEDYFELILPKMKSNGLIIFDNMLWGGRIIEQPQIDPEGIAIERLNRKLATDSRVESVLIPVADGLHLVRKR